MGQYKDFIITIITLVFGYLGALVPSLINKRSKRMEALKTIADSRQKWIDDIRCLYTDLVSVCDLFPKAEERDIPEAYLETFYRARNGMLIRLTHQHEPDLYPLDGRIISYLQGGISEVRNNKDALTDELRKMLLAEWKKIIETTGKAREQEIKEIQYDFARSFKSSDQS